MDDGVEVFKSNKMRRARSAGCVAVAAVLVLMIHTMASHPTTLVDVYIGVVAAIAVVFLIGAGRAWWIGIYLGPDGVVVRTTYAKRSWRWGELERVESIDHVSRGGPMGLAAMTIQHAEPRTTIVPVFRPVGKTPVPVRGLKVSTTTPEHPNWLDESLQQVNRAIAEHRTLGPRAARPS